MADAKTRDLSQRLLNELYRANPAADLRPTGVWIALFTTAPTETNPGVEVSTVGTAYARFQVVQNDTNWADPTIGLNAETISNGATFAFNQATANWGNVVAAATMTSAADAPSLTNMLHYGDLTVTPVTVNTGDTFQFAIGDFVIAER